MALIMINLQTTLAYQLMILKKGLMKKTAMTMKTLFGAIQSYQMLVMNIPNLQEGLGGPVKPVITFLECCQLYLTDEVVALVIQETNRMLGMKGTTMC